MTAKAAIERRAEAMRRQLQDRSIATLAIEYDGYADNGAIESVAARTADNRAITLPPALESQLIDLFYDLLEVRFDGWECGSGAFGEFTWDLRTDSLHHVHHARFETYDTMVAERRFGRAITLADGTLVPVREIAELHIKQDCGGRIPTVADWLGNMRIQAWMNRGYHDQDRQEETDGQSGNFL